MQLWVCGVGMAFAYPVLLRRGRRKKAWQRTCYYWSVETILFPQTFYFVSRCDLFCLHKQYKFVGGDVPDAPSKILCKQKSYTGSLLPSLRIRSVPPPSSDGGEKDRTPLERTFNERPYQRRRPHPSHRI